MATWNDKPIDALKDDELRQAFITVRDMNDNYNAAKQTEKYKEKFKNRIAPNVNPTFTDLFNSIIEEVNKRQLKI